MIAETALILASLCVMQPMQEAQVAKVEVHASATASWMPIPNSVKYEIFVLKDTRGGHGEPFYRIVSHVRIPIPEDGIIRMSRCTAHG